MEEERKQREDERTRSHEDRMWNRELNANIKSMMINLKSEQPNMNQEQSGRTNMIHGHRGTNTIQSMSVLRSNNAFVLQKAYCRKWKYIRIHIAKTVMKL